MTPATSKRLRVTSTLFLDGWLIWGNGLGSGAVSGFCRTWMMPLDANMLDSTRRESPMCREEIVFKESFKWVTLIASVSPRRVLIWLLLVNSWRERAWASERWSSRSREDNAWLEGKPLLSIANRVDCRVILLRRSTYPFPSGELWEKLRTCARKWEKRGWDLRTCRRFPVQLYPSPM